MKNGVLLWVILLITTSGLVSQVKTRSYIYDEALTPREHNVDFEHLKLSVDFEPEKGLVKGSVWHSFVTLQQNVDSIFLDGININVKSVKLNGINVEYKTYENGVTLYFNPLAWKSKHLIEITYECTPKKGIYFIGWNDPKGICRKQIWTQGQGIDNRHWIPMYDEQNDKITSEIIVKFNNKYKVLSNGVKLEEKPQKDGTTLWHYKMNKPHTSYLIMLGIGEYKIKNIKSKSGVNINLWYYPDWETRVEPTYRYSAEMVDFFENEIGVKYPWENYSQIPVQDFMFGAMENTTATIFGDFFMVDEKAYNDRNYVSVNAHELAHQWFGDMVSARCAAHHWLQESFATFYNWLYEYEVFGKEHYDWNRRNAANAAISETKKDYKPIANSSAGSTRHYPKGAHVLHMLRYVVGREQYNSSVKYYLEKHGYKNVDSEDLLIAFHENLGLSLDWFWEQWVYKGGEPHYQVRFYESIENNQKNSVFEVEQTHSTNEVVGLFKMPIWFEVYYADGSKDSLKVWIENKNHVVKIPNKKGKEIAFVLFDPNANIMKECSFIKSFEMLKKQALQAPSMIDRYDAVVAMREISIEQKKPLFLEIFNKEVFYAVKTEIVSQLFANNNVDIDFIRKALSDKRTEVKKAVLENTSTIPASLVSEYEKLLNDQSYSNIELALELLCYHFPENAGKYIEKVSDTEGAVGKSTLIKRLELEYFYTNKTEAVNQLVEFTSSSYEFRTRVNAANALKKLNYFNEKLLKNLVEASTKANNRLAQPSLDAIHYFSDQKKYSKTVADYFKLNPIYSSYTQFSRWY
ncbi:MAG: M1 family metallopeptidase [Flavobacteriales bacterium]|nr:M1 family metallopeptidase [Flavobacteriales bacterium]